MKSIKNSLIVLTLTIVLVFGVSQQVRAASCGDWNISYIPGAPAAGNQSSSICIDYYSGGYYVDCTTFSGGTGSKLKITSSSAGGMDPIIIEKAGRTEIWRLKGSTTGTVCFKISVMGNYPCRATGRICINQ